MSVTLPPMSMPPEQVAVPVPGMSAQGSSMRAPTSEQDNQRVSVNLAPSFTEKELEMMSSTVCDDYDADVASRAPRMVRCAEYQGLYASVMKSKSFPFQNAANVNLPILTYPMLQVQGRLYDMIWPANGKIIYSNPTNLGDMARAQITETFGNAYIRNKMPEMAQGLDDTLHQVCIYGSAFRRTYWNDFEERVASDWIPIADFVVMDTQRSQDPSMRDVPRYTLVQRLNRFDLEDWAAKGIYVNVDKIAWGDPDPKETSEQEAKMKVVEGVTPSNDGSSDDKARMVLEQHRRWRLPNRPEKNPAMDGKSHAVMITVDEESSQVLRVVVREEDDPTDHQRYQRQTQEYDAYTKSVEVFEAMLMAPPMIDPMTGIPAPAPISPPPAMPRWMKTDENEQPLPPAAQRVREICFFTHYRAFPSEGFYGLGFGDFLVGLNKAVNTITNQHIDGATLRNAKGGFISRNMKTQRGAISISPGELVEVDVPMGAIKDGIMWLDPPPNDPTTMPLIQLLISSADKLVASSDLMSGQTSGANRTAKETQILAEQMMMQITVLARRMKEAFRHELDKIWRCWGVFLPDEEIINIVGEDGDPRELRVGRSMFIPDALVMPAADPRTKTQRIDETMAVFMIVSQNPYLMASPSRDVLMRAVTEDVLRAHGAEKLLKLLPPPPQPPGPPQPPQPMPLEEEDANFLQSKPHPVHPGDDDIQHITEHEKFATGPAGSSMTKEMKAAHEQHRRDHHAQLIRKSAQRGGQPGGAPPPQGPPMGGPQ